MNNNLYVVLLENRKAVNEDIINRHVEFLKKLDQQDKLYLCGPFTDYPGGMVIIKAKNIEEATSLAKTDPFISEGYKTFTIRTLEVANKDNGYGL